jgi:superfamily II DNA or RNA helicase
MMQAGFDFTRSQDSGLIVPVVSGLTQSLRPYQVEAVRRGWEELEENRSTLEVLATGTGKTKIFTEMAEKWPEHAKDLSDRVLVVAHRDELLSQARERLANETGETVGLEQAQFFAGDERMVVASIQTMSMPNRLSRWKPDDFGLVIVDEAHHAPATTYRRVMDHFTDAKILGVTATPDRADEKAMGQCFESVAFVYEIEDAIKDGWLCPIRVRQIFIGEINLSACRTTAGDLNQGDLNSAMAVEEALHGVVKATLDESGDRRTLVFTTSVENAKRMAEIFCRYRSGCAKSVDGGTDLDERRAILAGHKRGEFQYLTNCGIATEGYDDPAIACIAQARPTKSRALHAQIIGRGLRPVAGKPDCLVLEFTGNTGKHHLASSVDILGGRYEEDEVEAAQEIIKKKPGTRADEALAQAHAEAIEKQKREEAARLAQLQAQVQYTVREFNPFDVLHLSHTKDDEWSERFGGKIASEKQIAALKKFKVDLPKDCTSHQASRLLGACIVRSKKGLASYGQVKVLTKFGIPAINVSFRHASEMIEAVKANGWKRPSDAVIGNITGRERQAGEDG